jgi:hypothetical protein
MRKFVSVKLKLVRHGNEQLRCASLEAYASGDYSVMPQVLRVNRGRVKTPMKKLAAKILVHICPVRRFSIAANDFRWTDFRDFRVFTRPQ